MTKTPKYLGRWKTKQDFIWAIKHAPKNQQFFDKDTIRFFGRQSFGCYVENGKAYFAVEFHQKYPRVAHYLVEPETLRLHTKGGWFEQSQEGRL